MQKEIYKSGNIIGAIKILKGQEILPDDSTLVQHNISDGDTVSVLIEPDHNIEVEVQCGPKVYKHNVSCCMTIRELKAVLIEKKQVAFFHRHLNLVWNDNDGSLPLHYYFVDTMHSKLETIGASVLIKSINSFNETANYKVARNTSVGDLKKIIVKTRAVCGVTDISMFVADGNDGYHKLDELETKTVFELLPEDKTVYFIEDKLSVNRAWSVYHQDKEFGKEVGRYIFTGSGWSYETVRTITLRIQEEMGIPVYSHKGSQSHPRTGTEK